MGGELLGGAGPAQAVGQGFGLTTFSPDSDPRTFYVRSRMPGNEASAFAPAPRSELSWPAVRDYR